MSSSTFNVRALAAGLGFLKYRQSHTMVHIQREVANIDCWTSRDSWSQTIWQIAGAGVFWDMMLTGTISE